MLLPEASAILNTRRDESVPLALFGAVTTSNAATITQSKCTCVPTASCSTAAMETNVKL